MTIPARIGTYTHTGQVRSIHLHEGGPAAAAALVKHWNTKQRVGFLIEAGDLLRLEPPEDGYANAILEQA